MINELKYETGVQTATRKESSSDNEVKSVQGTLKSF